MFTVCPFVLQPFLHVWPLVGTINIDLCCKKDEGGSVCLLNSSPHILLQKLFSFFAYVLSLEKIKLNYYSRERGKLLFHANQVSHMLLHTAMQSLE